MTQEIKVNSLSKEIPLNFKQRNVRATGTEKSLEGNTISSSYPCLHFMSLSLAQAASY